MNDEEKEVVKKKVYSIYYHGCQVFLESLLRDIDMNQLNRDINYKSTILNLMIISHGVTMWVFLMRWFKWTSKQFELFNNS
jgi:hypothetical protein